MKLGQILKGLADYELLGDLQQEITGVVCDSRLAHPGSLFVAVRGHKEDGHHYIQGALQRGAAAVVAEEIRDVPVSVARVRVSDSRRALSRLALQFYENPFKGLSLIGITGTNGKTTTTYVLESILKTSGASPGVLGTINYRFAGRKHPASVTTPESLDIIRLVREMADRGASHVVMEVSSHALDQGRVADCPFRVAVFTNLSRDHLDYHKTMNQYFKAKSRLFSDLLREEEPGPKPTAVINLDDSWGEALVSETRADLLTYGFKEKCQVRADSLRADKKGLAFRLITPAGERKIRSPLVGDFNVYNIMAGSAAAVAMGISLDAVAEGVEALKTIPGRLESVRNRAGLPLVVDYAHTPDALLKSLKALRPHVRGRLITVFGCGGDRDKGKRYDLGLTAGRESEVVFVTSDNPRSEDPLAIMEAVEKGVVEGGPVKKSWPPEDRSVTGVYFMEPDRRDAIRKAVSLAGGEDLILIAGKGHEDYQIIGNERTHFSDQEEAALAAEGLR
jgi:UDP-N-acetylmuramoyl-L-alanyl-D-glutamate--2,6-diaminopimelate ligase